MCANYIIHGLTGTNQIITKEDHGKPTIVNIGPGRIVASTSAGSNPLDIEPGNFAKVNATSGLKVAFEAGPNTADYSVGYIEWV